jgi:arylsulfatase A-like enzyme
MTRHDLISRRRFIQSSAASSLALAGIGFRSPGLSQAVKPNIIFIMADDLGYGELGSYGQQKIRTPRLDRMAAEGMRFTQFYSGSTVCAPSRATLLTGVHTGHSYVRDNQCDGPAESAKGRHRITWPPIGTCGRPSRS